MKELKDLKLKDIKKLRDMGIGELKTEIDSAEKNLYLLNIKLSLGELKQPHLIKPLRRYIARVKTIFNSVNS